MLKNAHVVPLLLTMPVHRYIVRGADAQPVGKERKKHEDKTLFIPLFV